MKSLLVLSILSSFTFITRAQLGFEDHIISEGGCIDIDETERINLY